MLRRGLVIIALGIAGVVLSAQAAQAADEPAVPEQVSTYFATGLVPRLVDLFGPGATAGSGIAFDATTKVGTIHRVFAWTPGFLAGTKVTPPTELTNNWIAPVTIANGEIAGLATVWINPASDLPELADFTPGPTLATALAAAPSGTVLIRDDPHSAWFATDDRVLTPLVTGTSKVTKPTTIKGYQRYLERASARAETLNPGANQGLFFATAVLGLVLVVLVAFVLFPARRRRVRDAASEVPPA